MPTATLQPLSRSRARNVAAAGLGYSIGVFGLLKLGWVETHVVLPVTQWQGRMGSAAVGAPVLPIDVTLACSGADAFALCAGAILAYPAGWRRRLTGTAAGVLLILVLNTIRIGTLGRLAASPFVFDALHLYVWPAVLILAIAAYVFTWMQVANRESTALPVAVTPTVAAPSLRVFVVWAVVFVLLFVALSPLYLHSDWVLRVGALVARCGAGILRAVGTDATAVGNVLWTPRGGFEVTQECISTPLIPLYAAAVMSCCRGWSRRGVALAAALPLFTLLGVARVLVVALPAAIVSTPLFLVHAFYQLLLAAVVVAIAVGWARESQRVWHGVIACAGGIVVALAMAPVYAWAFTLWGSTPFDDSQGAMAAMPSFQAGMFASLTIATLIAVPWRVIAVGAAALIVLQVAVVVACEWLVRFSDFSPQIRDVRAWAILAPLAIVVVGLSPHGRARH